MISLLLNLPEISTLLLFEDLACFSNVFEAVDVFGACKVYLADLMLETADLSLSLPSYAFERL